MIAAKLSVKSFEYGWLDIFWEFPPDILDLHEYRWRVLRSEGPAGPWEPLTVWLQDKYSLRDNVVPLFSRVREIFYLLEVQKISTGDVEKIGPVALEAEPDLVTLEIIRQVRMELMFSGRKAFLFPVRTFGVRCRECYDNIAGNRIKSHCLACFNTTFAGGFLSPILTYVDVGEIDHDTTLTDNMEITQGNTAARLPAFPPVKPGDLLITDLNERFRVEKVIPSEHRRAVYEQDIVLHEIPRGDIEYKVPVNLQDLRNFQPEPDDRVFRNPTSNDLDDAAIRFFSGLYGGVKL